MSKKNLFEIPESPELVVFRPGREISIDGKTVVEVDRRSPCARQRGVGSKPPAAGYPAATITGK